jgi:hypothetical protein
VRFLRVHVDSVIPLAIGVKLVVCTLARVWYNLYEREMKTPLAGRFLRILYVFGCGMRDLGPLLCTHPI